MFRRIMVANRGEIAKRIMRTAHAMGIETVAVFSEADKDAPYLKEATKCICIGPALAKDSYLCEDAILEAALATDSEAVHPGFGFLSENARFALRCEQQKLTFIGPAPRMIALMGDKAKARKTMADLGLPTLIGSDGIVSNREELFALAKQTGYPLLLKARAGGGGKGMRKVSHEGDLDEAFSQVRREATSAFGDGELYLEKFIENARHIEFQILGDHYGNVVCLGERECSIQRKNQKLIEEAPANGFPDETRRVMGKVLTDAMKKLKFTNAGTLEFLLGADGKLYFMEMNTRIQVEHPVTELVYGVDIVEWQIRIACNERLTLSANDIKIKGAAIECRINAEDPRNDFLPAPGVINELNWPNNDKAGPVRIDTHIEAGFRVVPFYDSMVAKIITYGESRKSALEAMKQALNETHIGGISTTLDFQRAILATDDFVNGTYDCSFLAKHWSTLLKNKEE